MHNENFGARSTLADGGDGTLPGSPSVVVQSRYMRLLDAAAGAFCAAFLRGGGGGGGSAAALPKSAALAALRRLLAQQLLTLYVRHVSYVRPIREAGKLKLAADMARFELVVDSIAGTPVRRAASSPPRRTGHCRRVHLFFFLFLFLLFLFLSPRAPSRRVLSRPRRSARAASFARCWRRGWACPRSPLSSSHRPTLSLSPFKPPKARRPRFPLQRAPSLATAAVRRSGEHAD